MEPRVKPEATAVSVAEIVRPGATAASVAPVAVVIAAPVRAASAVPARVVIADRGLAAIVGPVPRAEDPRASHGTRRVVPDVTVVTAPAVAVRAGPTSALSR